MMSINRSKIPSARRNWVISRRVFLKSSAASLAGLTALPLSYTLATSRPNTARIGILTDCHYADKDTDGSKYYRESDDKLSEFIRIMKKQEVDCLIETGDFIDEDDYSEAQTITNLQTIEQIFQGSPPPHKIPMYHVLGNHDMSRLSKSQFLSYITNTGIDSNLTYYSFDINGLHCVILDANYGKDGSTYYDYDHNNFSWTDPNIPPAERTWLEADLAAAQGPVLVFIHQKLDLHEGYNDDYCIKNDIEEIRGILEDSGKVLAVFQGHRHVGEYSYINDIHYCNLKAMVTDSGEANNSYAIIEVHPDRSITVSACRNEIRREFDARCSVADLTGDCEVDFGDFAKMANDWLDKGL
ncbi:MAG: metallophosphoesterase [Planctomycetes bacterium]|nr:metallophosphoesterase [Planctomycetota bacterium]